MKFMVVTLLLSALIASSSSTETTVKFAPCPHSPNCVSTQETRKLKKMNPIQFEGNIRSAEEKLKAIIRKNKSAKLVEHTNHYIHYEFTTKMGQFIDDVEFLLDSAKKVIHYKSASRTGFGDFGKNRRRMKQFARDWELTD